MPSWTAATIIGFMYLDPDPPAGPYIETHLQIGGSGGFIALRTGTTDGAYIYHDWGTWGGSDFMTMARGVWYAFSMAVGADRVVHIRFKNLSTGTVTTTGGTNPSWATSITELWLGNFTYSNRSFSEYAGWRMFNFEMTDTQVDTEWTNLLRQYGSGSLGNWPMSDTASKSNCLIDADSAGNLVEINGTGFTVTSNLPTLSGPAAELSVTMACESSLTAGPLNGIAAALSGTLTAAALLTPDIKLQQALGGTLACSSTLTLALTNGIRLNATLNSQAALSNSLDTAILLTANYQVQSAITSDLGTGIQLSASLTADSSLTPSLSSAILLASTLDSLSSLSGTLTGTAQLNGSIESESSLTGMLTASEVPLNASVAVNSSLSGELTTTINLSSTMVSQVSLNIVTPLNTQILLDGALISESTFTPSLTTVPSGFSTWLESLVAASASLTTQIQLNSEIDIGCSLTASLSTEGDEDDYPLDSTYFIVEKRRELVR